MTGFYATGEVATGWSAATSASPPVVTSTVTSVTVSPSSALLGGGGTVDFDWVINGTNSPSQAATVATTLGTINSAGMLTAPAATSSVQNGTVTVTSTQDATKSGTATFTVAALSSPAQPGMIAASKVSAARRVIFSGGTRVVVFDVPSLQKDKDKDALMTNSARPYFKDGKWFVDKDPEEKSYYVADLTQELNDRATTATSVQVLVAGVKLLEGPSIQGSLIVVKLSEMDTSAGADNFWTARVTCANTEQFDRTTWLNRVDN